MKKKKSSALEGESVRATQAEQTAVTQDTCRRSKYTVCKGAAASIVWTRGGIGMEPAYPAVLITHLCDNLPKPVLARF